jgi:tRNA threonylcarbamoyladenosine biosynthesis protein TsaB
VNLLALDTSSLACSVALQIGSDVTQRYEEQAREHTRLLLPMISSIMKDADIAFADLDAIVLGNGPGSFIGMRISASVAQGLAFASGKKVVAVSSLAAIAAQVMQQSDAAEVIVTQDAHMGEVYVGCFKRGDNALPVASSAEYLHGQGALTDLGDNPELIRIAAGFGWSRYPDLLTENTQLFTQISDVLHPAARFLLALGAADLAAGKAVEPEEVMPAYLREKVAAVPARP